MLATFTPAFFENDRTHDWWWCSSVLSCLNSFQECFTNERCWNRCLINLSNLIHISHIYTSLDSHFQYESTNNIFRASPSAEPYELITLRLELFMKLVMGRGFAYKSGYVYIFNLTKNKEPCKVISKNIFRVQFFFGEKVETNSIILYAFVWPGKHFSDYKKRKMGNKTLDLQSFSILLPRVF